MKIELETPFKELWKSGYIRQSAIDGRKRVDLFNSSRDRTTISHSRYVMCVSIGSMVPDGYEVDHIDKDVSNDSPDNLQVLSKSDHLEKTVREATTGRTYLDLVCCNCSRSFKREKRQMKKNSAHMCSRSCNAQFNRKFKNWAKKPNTESAHPV